ncbi:MAG TPA: hypothetical protein PKA41_10565 [Verrucomicrobiota bacterium]|nr:hypothetical protein [Verrucomicrobiota bacterium]
MKTPSTNHQTPEKHQVPILKQVEALWRWSLMFEVSLELGVWNLEL